MRAGRSQGSKSASASMDGGRQLIATHGLGRAEAAEQFAPWDGPAALMKKVFPCHPDARASGARDLL